ncbi:ROK family protein [Jannaschia sp. LMIT008]|uniref:ROK family protein n=1 Tax=Jannaschia maritima TaxID=3032585 RepID=UPI0028122F3D|nr:ROK family protein [Jannaschia sp. LMIT008]
MIGGIDLGGTKMEARLFEGPDAATVASRRVATPLASFDALCTAALDLIAWLDAEAGRRVSVGVALPGLADPRTGAWFAANVPLTGHLPADVLSTGAGRPVTVVGDGAAFAVSEARGGAADGVRVVMGLILGTGVGGGLCVDGVPPPRHGDLPLEVGHVGAPAAALARHDLPLWDCCCGRAGCNEVYASGTGLARIASWRTGRPVRVEDGVPGDVLTIWIDVLADVLRDLHLLVAPEAVVLGGGASRVDRLTERLTDALHPRMLGPQPAPRILRALHGDSSGARGAALLAADRAAA